MEPSQDNIRKRVCKACDRCRLKKSKCDGANPCSRCKADNAICVFGERKKSQDKVYPKGYVEMLEQQQHQLVAGLRKLYSMSQNGQSWPGEPLATAQGGHPLTHDILERLDVLHLPSENGQQLYEGFEEDCNRMQQKLMRGTKRRGSTSSSSDRSHISSPSSHSDAPMPRALKCIPGPFALHNAPPTPPAHSPFTTQAQIVSSSKMEPPLSPAFMSNTALDPSALRSPWTGEPMMVDEMDPRFMNAFSTYNYPSMLSNDPMNSAGPMLPDWNEPDFELTNFMDHTVST